jgi:hypothetical protein
MKNNGDFHELFTIAGQIVRALLLIPPFCLWHDFFSHAPARPATPGGGRLNIFLAAAAAVSCNTEKIQDGNIGISVAVNVLPCQREMNSSGRA